MKYMLSRCTTRTLVEINQIPFDFSNISGPNKYSIDMEARILYSIAKQQVKKWGSSRFGVEILVGSGLDQTSSLLIRQSLTHNKLIGENLTQPTFYFYHTFPRRARFLWIPAAVYPSEGWNPCFSSSAK